MPKTALLIPGFKRQFTSPSYVAARQLIKACGYKTIAVPVVWNNRVLSQQASDVWKFAKKYPQPDLLLGFSLGAMLALITEPDIQPKQLFLCSLSPYWQEDVKSLKKSWLRVIGKRRMADFSTLNNRYFAERVRAKTTLFVGERETPRLVKRVHQTNSHIAGSTLVTIPRCEHKISSPEYLAALQFALEVL